MKFTGLACLLLALSIAVSGCIDPGEDEDLPGQEEEEEAPQWVTKTWEATYGGTVPVGTPGHMDEVTGACEELTGGHEDTTYTWASFDVNNTPSQAQIVLEWAGQDVGGVWVFPDLELRLVDPDGEYIDECEGITGGSPETLSLSLDKNGTYKAQIINYAGVMVDYELHVTLTYQVQAQPAEIEVIEEDDNEA